MCCTALHHTHCAVLCNLLAVFFTAKMSLRQYTVQPELADVYEFLQVYEVYDD